MHLDLFDLALVVLVLAHMVDERVSRYLPQPPCFDVVSDECDLVSHDFWVILLPVHQLLTMQDEGKTFLARAHGREVGVSDEQLERIFKLLLFAIKHLFLIVLQNWFSEHETFVLTAITQHSLVLLDVKITGLGRQIDLV